MRPFSEKQIQLLKTFADQAVIAIENARLFDEVQARTADVSEALLPEDSERCVEVIGRSASNRQPVFDAIVETAAGLCGADMAVLRLLRRRRTPPRRVQTGARTAWSRHIRAGSNPADGPVVGGRTRRP